MISISLVGEIEFWLYIHGEGEEFYLHYDFWPSVPKIHHVRRPEASTDFVIKKSTEISDGNCYPAKEYSYFGNCNIKSSINDIKYSHICLVCRIRIIFSKL